MEPEDVIVARIPLVSPGELIVTYSSGGVDLSYQNPPHSDFTFPLDPPQCEVLETALRAARLAARKL